MHEERSRLKPEEVALIENNLDLAERLARRWSGGRYRLDDMRCEAYGGLMHAATRWRPGIRSFPDYAAKVICRWLDNYRRDEPLPPALFARESEQDYCSETWYRVRMDEFRNRLDPVRLEVYDLYFGAGLTLEEVGVRIGRGKSRVHEMVASMASLVH